jgi:hypothetical protein
VLFKTLVRITWKWVIYYTADALKSLYRRQYRTRTLKENATQKTKTLSSYKELTSWVKLQVEIFCKASLRLILPKISTCSLRLALQKIYICSLRLALQNIFTCSLRLASQKISTCSLRLALHKISTCSLTHDVKSLEDDNITYQEILFTNQVDD